MSDRGFAKTLGLLAVAIVIAALLIYLSLESSIPRPDESRRVVHGEGFSIIGPEGWVWQVIFAIPGTDARNAISFVDVKSETYPGMLTLTLLDKAPSEASLRGDGFETAHLGRREAFRKETTSDIEKMRTVVYRLHANGRWYEIMLRRPLSEPIDPVWMAYLNSFRPAPEAGVPATAPSARPHG